MDKVLNWLILKWIKLATLSNNGYQTGETISKFPHQANPETDREKLERIFNDVYRN